MGDSALVMSLSLKIAWALARVAPTVLLMPLPLSVHDRHTFHVAIGWDSGATTGAHASPEDAPRRPAPRPGGLRVGFVRYFAA